MVIPAFLDILSAKRNWGRAPEQAVARWRMKGNARAVGYLVADCRAPGASMRPRSHVSIRSSASALS
jgi:hypothetical protein